jgi:hypothetical protein
MDAAADHERGMTPDSDGAFMNREPSCFCFAGRVLELDKNPEAPLFERVEFAGMSAKSHARHSVSSRSGPKRAERFSLGQSSRTKSSSVPRTTACQLPVF